MGMVPGYETATSSTTGVTDEPAPQEFRSRYDDQQVRRACCFPRCVCRTRVDIHRVDRNNDRRREYRDIFSGVRCGFDDYRVVVHRDLPDHNRDLRRRHGRRRVETSYHRGHSPLAKNRPLNPCVAQRDLSRLGRPPVFLSMLEGAGGQIHPGGDDDDDDWFFFRYPQRRQQGEAVDPAAGLQALGTARQDDDGRPGSIVLAPHQREHARSLPPSQDAVATLATGRPELQLADPGRPRAHVNVSDFP